VVALAGWGTRGAGTNRPLARKIYGRRHRAIFASIARWAVNLLSPTRERHSTSKASLSYSPPPPFSTSGFVDDFERGPIRSLDEIISHKLEGTPSAATFPASRSD